MELLREDRSFLRQLLLSTLLALWRSLFSSGKVRESAELLCAQSWHGLQPGHTTVEKQWREDDLGINFLNEQKVFVVPVSSIYSPLLIFLPSLKL